MNRTVGRLSDRLRRLLRQVARVLAVAVVVWFLLRVMVAYVLGG